ncbi:hypothetical protein HJFPF1_13431 [Paramyrothecium foliicola]|nr:hypothetical protein HJFPF1_13431 [Paramyrothecium foliicola]
MATNQFEFISWKPLTERSHAEDHQIRSHCMKGRNKRPDSRRSKREAKRAASDTSDKADATKTTEGPAEDDFAANLWLLRSRNYNTLEKQTLASPVDLNPFINKLAENARKSPRALLNEFTVFLRISEATTVLEALIDFKFPSTRPVLPPLDDTMVQGMMLINSATHDHGQHRPFADVSASILAKALNLLNQKLAKADAVRDISTIFTIAFLATVAGSTGEVDAFKAHLSGLHKTIKLRGGFRSLDPWPKLQEKIESLDMVLALSLGSDPYFLISTSAERDTSPGDPPADSDTASSAGSPNGASSFFQRLDPRLRAIFYDLKDMNALLNQHFNNAKKVDFKVYSPSWKSISTRLLHLERKLDKPLDMCICLGMLCFFLSLFKMPTKLPTYRYINDRLREANKGIRDSKQLPPPAILKWLVIMSAMSVVDPMEPWLHEAWTAAVKSGVSWEDVHKQVKEVLWIDKAHDNLGKAAYAVLSRMRVSRKPI